MRFVVRVAINAFAIWIVTLLPALHVWVVPFPPGGTLPLIVTLVAVGALFAVVNGILGRIIRIVAFPLYILTLGLISLVVNGALLSFTAWLTHWWGWGLHVPDFWQGVVAALIIGIINGILGGILRPRRAR